MYITKCKANTNDFLGLHLSPKAYRLFASEMIAVIAKTWPDQVSEELNYALPAWDDAGFWASEGLQMGKRGVVRHE